MLRHSFKYQVIGGMRRHSDAEKIEFLVRARHLAAAGVLQEKIVKDLGISVMTLHRWRNAPKSESLVEGPASNETARLEFENCMFRKLIVDFLLEIDAVKNREGVHVYSLK